MTDRRTCIYAWICPNTSKPVYVGKTSVTVAVRQKSHLFLAREGIEPSLKYTWLREILSQGKEPSVMELEWCSADVSGEIERIWVKLLSKRFSLLNTAVAGSGGPGIGRVVWTDALISRLGKERDYVIAKVIGCNRKTVAYRRVLLGISPCTLPKELPTNTIILPVNVLGRLGTAPDDAIARELNISQPVVQRHRHRLGIKPYAIQTGNDGRFRAGHVSHNASDITDDIVALLGTMPDEDLGQQYGLSKSVIFGERQRRDIKSYAEVRDKNERQRKQHSRCRRKPDAVVSLLGTMTDQALADMFGLAACTIGNERRRRGIPSYSTMGRNRGSQFDKR